MSAKLRWDKISKTGKTFINIEEKKLNYNKKKRKIGPLRDKIKFCPLCKTSTIELNDKSKRYCLCIFKDKISDSDCANRMTYRRAVSEYFTIKHNR